jgi:hypothetical protein
MDQLSLFEMPEEVALEPYLPDEIFDSEEFEIHIYYEEHETFYPWLRAVNEHLLDMTGYSLHQFYTVPALEQWADWPSDTYECALTVLSKDAWGQEFLTGLDRE